MKNYSVDIHVHSTLKPFYHEHNNPLSIWDTIENDCGAVAKWVWNIAAGKTLRATQGALSQAAAGHVKIVGISIFTYESGWTGKGANIKKGLLSCLSGMSEQKIMDIHKRTDDRIYTDTIEEFEYLAKAMNKKYMLDGQEWQLKFLTKDVLQKIHDNQLDIENENTIYIFLNIEGIQSLGIESMKDNVPSVPLKPHDVIIKKRVNEIKNTWKSIPQYITLCHHFGNHMAGHARSIPFPLTFSQIKMRGDGLTTMGKSVLKEILGDKDRTILIDIKHLSAAARIDYYKYVKHLSTQFPHLKNYPILCSHTAFVNNEEKLSELVEQKDDGHKLKNAHLHNWSINLCKEDLKMIQNTNGLIGLQIDLKRLAGKKYLKLFEKAATAQQRKALSCEIVWANVFTAIAYLDNKAAWELLCIGSDYDGLVSYLPGFSTLADYPALKTELKKSLDHMNFIEMEHVKVGNRKLTKGVVKELMYDYSSAQLIDKLFSENAVRFWKDHFIDQTQPAANLIPKG